jgi:PIN domain nuclease of toxin-antitoxin system
VVVVTTVLDAWAVMALYEDHPCAEDVETAINTSEALICSVNLGEVLYTLEREYGSEQATGLVELARSVMTVEDPDWDLVAGAARVKAGGGLSYADAFCVATAQRHDAPIYTGDPEILALGGLVELVDLRAGSAP